MTQVWKGFCKVFLKGLFENLTKEATAYCQTFHC